MARKVSNIKPWIVDFLLSTDPRATGKSLHVLKYVSGPHEDGSIVKQATDLDVFINVRFTLHALAVFTATVDSESSDTHEEFNRAFILLRKYWPSHVPGNTKASSHFEIVIDDFALWMNETGLRLKLEPVPCMDVPEVRQKSNRLWLEREKVAKKASSTDEEGFAATEDSQALMMSMSSIPLSQLVDQITTCNQSAEHEEKEESSLSGQQKVRGGVFKETQDLSLLGPSGLPISLPACIDMSVFHISADQQQQLDSIPDWKLGYRPPVTVPYLSSSASNLSSPPKSLKLSELDGSIVKEKAPQLPGRRVSIPEGSELSPRKDRNSPKSLKLSELDTSLSDNLTQRKSLTRAPLPERPWRRTSVSDDEKKEVNTYKVLGTLTPVSQMTNTSSDAARPENFVAKAVQVGDSLMENPPYAKAVKLTDMAAQVGDSLLNTQYSQSQPVTETRADFQSQCSLRSSPKDTSLRRRSLRSSKPKSDTTDDDSKVAQQFSNKGDKSTSDKDSCEIITDTQAQRIISSREESNSSEESIVSISSIRHTRSRSAVSDVSENDAKSDSPYRPQTGHGLRKCFLSPDRSVKSPMGKETEGKQLPHDVGDYAQGVDLSSSQSPKPVTEGKDSKDQVAALTPPKFYGKKLTNPLIPSPHEKVTPQRSTLNNTKAETLKTSKEIKMKAGTNDTNSRQLSHDVGDYGQVVDLSSSESPKLVTQVKDGKASASDNTSSKLPGNHMSRHPLLSSAVEKFTLRRSPRCNKGAEESSPSVTPKELSRIRETLVTRRSPRNHTTEEDELIDRDIVLPTPPKTSRRNFPNTPCLRSMHKRVTSPSTNHETSIKEPDGKTEKANEQYPKSSVIPGSSKSSPVVVSPELGSRKCSLDMKYDGIQEIPMTPLSNKDQQVPPVIPDIVSAQITSSSGSAENLEGRNVYSVQSDKSTPEVSSEKKHQKRLDETDSEYQMQSPHSSKNPMPYHSTQIPSSPHTSKPPPPLLLELSPVEPVEQAESQSLTDKNRIGKRNVGISNRAQGNFVKISNSGKESQIWGTAVLEVIEVPCHPNQNRSSPPPLGSECSPVVIDDESTSVDSTSPQDHRKDLGSLKDFAAVLGLTTPSREPLPKVNIPVSQRTRSSLCMSPRHNVDHKSNSALSKSSAITHPVGSSMEQQPQDTPVRRETRASPRHHSPMSTKEIKEQTDDNSKESTSVEASCKKWAKVVLHRLDLSDYQLCPSGSFLLPEPGHKAGNSKLKSVENAKTNCQHSAQLISSAEESASDDQRDVTPRSRRGRPPKKATQLIFSTEESESDDDTPQPRRGRPPKKSTQLIFSTEESASDDQRDATPKRGRPPNKLATKSEETSLAKGQLSCNRESSKKHTPKTAADEQIDVTVTQGRPPKKQATKSQETFLAKGQHSCNRESSKEHSAESASDDLIDATPKRGRPPKKQSTKSQETPLAKGQHGHEWESSKEHTSESASDDQIDVTPKRGRPPKKQAMKSQETSSTKGQLSYKRESSKEHTAESASDDQVDTTPKRGRPPKKQATKSQETPLAKEQHSCNRESSKEHTAKSGSDDQIDATPKRGRPPKKQATKSQETSLTKGQHSCTRESSKEHTHESASDDEIDVKPSEGKPPEKSAQLTSSTEESTSDDQVDVTPKRGRPPKKQATKSQENSATKGQHSFNRESSKEHTAESASDDQIDVTPKRGRPPKTQATKGQETSLAKGQLSHKRESPKEHTSESASGEHRDVTPRRGRPPKKSTQLISSAEKSASDEVTPQARRGRPPKKQATQGEETSLTEGQHSRNRESSKAHADSSDKEARLSYDEAKTTDMSAKQAHVTTGQTNGRINELSVGKLLKTPDIRHSPRLLATRPQDDSPDVKNKTLQKGEATKINEKDQQIPLEQSVVYSSGKEADEHRTDTSGSQRDLSQKSENKQPSKEKTLPVRHSPRIQTKSPQVALPASKKGLLQEGETMPEGETLSNREKIKQSQIKEHVGCASGEHTPTSYELRSISQRDLPQRSENLKLPKEKSQFKGMDMEDPLKTPPCRHSPRLKVNSPQIGSPGGLKERTAKIRQSSRKESPFSDSPPQGKVNKSLACRNSSRPQGDISADTADQEYITDDENNKSVDTGSKSTSQQDRKGASISKNFQEEDDTYSSSEQCGGTSISSNDSQGSTTSTTTTSTNHSDESGADMDYIPRSKIANSSSKPTTRVLRRHPEARTNRCYIDSSPEFVGKAQNTEKTRKDVHKGQQPVRRTDTESYDRKETPDRIVRKLRTKHGKKDQCIEHIPYFDSPRSSRSQESFRVESESDRSEVGVGAKDVNNKMNEKKASVPTSKIKHQDCVKAKSMGPYNAESREKKTRQLSSQETEEGSDADFEIERKPSRRKVNKSSKPQSDLESSEEADTATSQKSSDDEDYKPSPAKRRKIPIQKTPKKQESASLQQQKTPIQQKQSPRAKSKKTHHSSDEELSTSEESSDSDDDYVPSPFVKKMKSSGKRTIPQRKRESSAKKMKPSKRQTKSKQTMSVQLSETGKIEILKEKDTAYNVHHIFSATKKKSAKKIQSTNVQKRRLFNQNTMLGEPLSEIPEEKQEKKGSGLRERMASPLRPVLVQKPGVKRKLYEISYESSPKEDDEATDAVVDSSESVQTEAEKEKPVPDKASSSTSGSPSTPDQPLRPRASSPRRQEYVVSGNNDEMGTSQHDSDLLPEGQSTSGSHEKTNESAKGNVSSRNLAKSPKPPKEKKPAAEDIKSILVDFLDEETREAESSLIKDVPKDLLDTMCQYFSDDQFA